MNLNNNDIFYFKNFEILKKNFNFVFNFFNKIKKTLNCFRNLRDT